MSSEPLSCGLLHSYACCLMLWRSRASCKDDWLAMLHCWYLTDTISDSTILHCWSLTHAALLALGEWRLQFLSWVLHLRRHRLVLPLLQLVPATWRWKGMSLQWDRICTPTSLLPIQLVSAPWSWWWQACHPFDKPLILTTLVMAFALTLSLEPKCWMH